MITVLALALGLILGASVTWFTVAMRDLGPQPVIIPRLSPAVRRLPPVLEYEVLQISHAMAARERYRQLAWEALWPHERECPAGSFAVVAS